MSRYIRELLSALPDVLRDEEHVTVFAQRAGLEVLPAASPSVSYKVLRGGPAWRRILTQQLLLRSSSRHFDIVHFPDYLTPFLWGTTPFVVTLHDMAYAADAEYFTVGRRLLRRLANPLAVQRAKRLIVDSAFTRSEVLRSFPDIPPSRVSVVYPGVPRFNSARAWSEVAERYKLPAQFVLSVATLEPRKNLDRLIQAFALRELAGESLVLVGRPGWGRRVEKRLPDVAGLRQRVFVIGHVPDDELAAIYAHATAFAYVSLYEGFGLPALEALGAGVPTIAADIPVLRETTRGAALYVDPRSPESIAAGIRQVLDNRELQARLVTNGISVAATYSWRSCAAGLADIYRVASKR